jgi:dTDP-4-amino-4,6-dideoxygalactose transaminase
MVVSKNKKFIDRIRRLRMYGEEERYRSTEVSGVSRLDELQAAILRVKLRHLVEWNRRRRTIASEYMRRLHGIGDIRFVNNESENGNQEFRSCFHLFVIRTKYRDRLKTYLTKQGIGSGIHYPVPVHLTDAFRNLKYKVGDFPIAEQQAREILSLPMYPELTYSEAETVASAIRRFFRL